MRLYDVDGEGVEEFESAKNGVHEVWRWWRNGPRRHL